MRNRPFSRCLILVAALLYCGVTASAYPVTWQVRAAFDDTGIATGSFVFDADTNTFTAVDITTTTGTTRTGAHYTKANLVAAGSSFVLLLTNATGNLTGTPSFAAQLVSPMTDAGGLINFDLSAPFHQEESCMDAGCTGGTTPRRFMISGAVSTTVTSDSPFQVRYGANPAAGESYINIVNTGANGASLLGPGFGAAAGNICVNVYAFSPDEQLIACCSCFITPNAVVSLGINRDLTIKTLTGVVPTSVVVKLLATLAGPGGTGGASSCNNSAATVTTGTIVGGMAAWGTSLHSQAAGFATTETAFTPATLSAGERASIAGRCSSILGNGSGFGVCLSCRTGALGGTKIN
jgi:hypothetical protein